MNISFGSLMPALANLGAYFKQGVDHYAVIKASGADLSPDMLAMFIHAKMEGWNPKIGGKVMLDHETSVAASRFLAGIIINLTAGQDS